MTTNDKSLGIVITQKDEGLLLQANVCYHLAVGVAHIVIVDNDSSEPETVQILTRLNQKSNVTVVIDHAEAFDQERLANEGLVLLVRTKPDIGWVMSLDVDEFLGLPTGMEGILEYCREAAIVYGAVPLFNGIPDVNCEHGSLKPRYLASHLFYKPFPERGWQEVGHFSKAICRVHDKMRIAVGNHYFYHEHIKQAFPDAPLTPRAIDHSHAMLLHYEMRDAGTELLQKWHNLSRRHRVPNADPNAAWWEKRDRMIDMESRFRGNPAGLYAFVVEERRTLWGSTIHSRHLVCNRMVSTKLTA